MTHINEESAQKTLALLLDIGGVFAAAVRAQPEPPKTPTEVREEVEASYDRMLVEERPVELLGSKHEWVTATMRSLLEEIERNLAAAPPPFPHLTEGTKDLAHYLIGLTNLLGPGFDESIDAKVGATRMVAESWDHLIVAVAVPVRDPGIKSLLRGLRRTRQKMEKL